MPHVGDRLNTEAAPADIGAPSPYTLELTAAQRTLLEHVAREVGADTPTEALSTLIGRHSRQRAGVREQEMDAAPVGPRFLTIPSLAEELSTSSAQVYALVRSGELPAIKIGGRGQWRIERPRFEAWVREQYALTRAFLLEHPYPGDTDKSD